MHGLIVRLTMRSSSIARKVTWRLTLVGALAGCNATPTCGSWTLPDFSFSRDPTSASTTATTSAYVATRPTDTNATTPVSSNDSSDDEEASAEPPSSSFIARAALMSANAVPTSAPLRSSNAPNQSLVSREVDEADATETRSASEPPPPPQDEQSAPDPLAQQYDDQGGAARNVMVVPWPIYGDRGSLSAATRRVEEQAPYPQGNGTTSSIPIPSGATNNTVGLTNPPEIPRPVYYPTPAGGNNVRVVIPNPPLGGGPSVFTSPRPGH